MKWPPWIQELNELSEIGKRIDNGSASPEEIARAIDFVCGNSRGFRHNRYRAWLARRLPKLGLTKSQIEKLTTSILGKLRSGDIDENFKDQLRLIFRINQPEFYKCAEELISDKKEYISRYAKMMLRMKASSNHSLQGRRP